MCEQQFCAPQFSEGEVQNFAQKMFGVDGIVRQLNSYADQNFYIKSSNGQEFVFKIANAANSFATLDLQNQAMVFLAEHESAMQFPRVCNTISGQQITEIQDQRENSFYARMLTFLPGQFVAKYQPYQLNMLFDLGEKLGIMNRALQQFSYAAAIRDFPWELQNTLNILPYMNLFDNPPQRRLVEYFLLQFETAALPRLPSLRKSIIHNDANEFNILVGGGDASTDTVTGLIDFGDVVYSNTICEPAVAAAYMMMNQEKPLEAAAAIVRGYHSAFPVQEAELGVLFHLVCARLCISVTMSTREQQKAPENEYISASQKPAWELLEKLLAVNPEFAEETFRRACGFSPLAKRGLGKKEIVDFRQQHLGKSLSISYQKPLKIVRGAMQYLYEENGRAYLDCVNNVCHVGHCHPHVVRALRDQALILNTNTRYLHDNIIEYTRRLIAKFSKTLSVCFFVNSGSEANELAIRLARAHTGQTDCIVIDHAYHGNTNAVIELSPYKFDSTGGSGAPNHIQKVPIPDLFRGLYRADDEDAASKYANHVQDALRNLKRQNRGIAAFFAESLPGCGGQIVFPDGYLKAAYNYIRNAGGVCVADEVQIGFGRVGSHFWGFETQGVVPDIVTLGKPIGNGHPLGAVVTTAEIAESFFNGMEYFNTFGGNPVSCAVGLAVLDVIENENLQENANAVGKHFKNRLQQLQEKHTIIGDVRGLGLYLGVELVKDRETLEPAAGEAATIIEKMKDAGILLSTDGPLHNVIKIKPPIVFSEENADLVVETLDRVLAQIDN